MSIERGQWAMKEIWIIIGFIFCFKNTPQGVFVYGFTDSSQSENISSVSISVYDKVETIDKVSSSFLTVTQWITTTLPSQTKKQLSETIIASKNNANGFVTAVIHEPILPALSTIHVAQSRTNVLASGVLSTNVSLECSTKYSSLNNPNGFSSRAKHILAVSSKPTVTIPEIATTTSHFNGISLPFTSEDKKYLCTSQIGDYSNGDNSQEAFTKSALSDLCSKNVIDKTTQFKSANSILGQINIYVTSAHGTRLFTKGSLSLTKLPRASFLLGSRTIWETTELNARYVSATILFSEKAYTPLIHATKTSHSNMSTATAKRNYSSWLSGIPQEIKASKTIVNNSFFQTISSLSSTTQMAASSVANSSAEKEISPFLSIVTPSVSNKVRKLSSHTSSATIRISKTPMIRQPLTSEVKSQLSLTLESEFQASISRNTKEFSSRDYSTFVHGLRKSTSDSSTLDSALISFLHGAHTISVPQETVESSLHFFMLAQNTFSLAISPLQTQSRQSRTRQAKLDTSIANSTMITETFVAKTSANLKPSSQAPKTLSSLSLSLTKAEVMTEWRTQSSTSRENFLNTRTSHHSQLLRSISAIGGYAVPFLSPQVSSMKKLTVLSGQGTKNSSPITQKRSFATIASYQEVQMSKNALESELQISHFPSSQSPAISKELAASLIQQVKSSSTFKSFQQSSSTKPRTSESISVNGHQSLFSSSLNAVASGTLSSLQTKSSSKIPQQRQSTTSVSYPYTQISKSTLGIGHRIHSSSQRIAAEHFVSSSSHIQSSSLLPRRRTPATTVSNIDLETRSLKSTSDIGHQTLSSSQRVAILHVTDLFAPSSTHIRRSSVLLQRKSTSVTPVTYKGTPVSKSASKIAQKIHSSSWSTANLHETERFTPPSSLIQTSSMLPRTRPFAIGVTTSKIVHQIRSSSQSIETRVSKSTSETAQHTVKLTETVAPPSSVMKSNSALPKESDSFSTLSYNHARISVNSSDIEHEIFSTSSWRPVMSTGPIAPSSSGMRSPSQVSHEQNAVFTGMSHTISQLLISTSTSETGDQALLSSTANRFTTTGIVAPSSSGMKSPSQVSHEKSSVFTGMRHTIPQLLMSTSISETGSQALFSSTVNRFTSIGLIAPSSSGMKILSQASHERSSVLRLASCYTIIQPLITKSISKIGKEILSSSPEISVSSTKLPVPVTTRMKNPSRMSAMGSLTTSKDQNLIPLIKSTVTTHIDKRRLQTSAAIVLTTPPGKEITAGIIAPLPDESLKSYKAAKTDLGDKVLPTQTRSSTATVPSVPGNISTQSPTTASTDFGHIKLLIIVAIIPSVILCAFFVAVLIFRRSRKRRNKAVYSIKLEYADENNGSRKRCVNSRLDLSLKGIHIDLEFPYDCERRGSYARDSYSRGSSLSETQIRELQILSQECKENMQWISEVIAREMEASIGGVNAPANRDSVYSVKEKENYEPSEKVRSIVRRESSKRGRETVKWRVPVVQRRDSEDFDQRDSMCTEDTTLEWKEGQRTTPRNCGESGRKASPKLNNSVKESADNANLDKGFQVQLSNKRLDGLQTQEKDKKEKGIVELKPLTVDMNPKKEGQSQEKRSSPRRFQTL